MADVGRNLKSENPNGDWTVVRRRRKTLPKPKPQPQPQSQSQILEESKPWKTPPDSQTDPQTQSKLMQKMQITLTKLESSDFYRTFVAQIQTLRNFSRVLSSSSEPQMHMVVYGIGSIESYEPPRLQLSLAILLARRFDWIGGRIEIFDPIISATESAVMEALGGTVLSIDEQGRREAEKPTLFFMPHCEAVLYNNLMETNWRPERLNRMVVFGNSFERYERFVTEFKGSVVAESARYVLEARRFVEEVEIETVSEDFFRAFHDTSWHFFDLDPDMEMDPKSPKKN